MSLFEDAPVAIWEEDFSAVRQYLEGLRDSGVADLRSHLAEHPEVVSNCIRLVKVLRVNRMARDFYGVGTTEELITMLPELFDEASFEIFRDEVATFAEGGRFFEAELRTNTFRGEQRLVHMNVSIAPVSQTDWSQVLVAFVDITAQRRMEEELVQAQKLDSVGRLAGGVAHDLNNLLLIINGYTDLLLENLSQNHPDYASLNEIRSAGSRAASLTEQLLAFGRRQALQPRVFHPNTLINDSLGLLRRAVGPAIRITTKLDPNLGSSHADPAQIHRVLLNLVINARDAMPNGGAIQLVTENVHVDGREARLIGVPPGPYVRISVIDTGTGMDRQTLERVFDPFFTTKPLGKGTGLGASSAFGIAKQSGGAITVSSELNKGSSFHLYLPRTENAKAAGEASGEPVPELAGNETILVVEDEPEVRRLIVRSLSGYGYKVLEAATGAEALEIWSRLSQSIDLILTDVRMPQMTGAELAVELFRDHPALKLIYMSGYADAVDMPEISSGPKIHYLQKPFLPQTLAKAIRRLLSN